MSTMCRYLEYELKGECLVIVRECDLLYDMPAPARWRVKVEACYYFLNFFL